MWDWDFNFIQLQQLSLKNCRWHFSSQSIISLMHSSHENHYFDWKDLFHKFEWFLDIKNSQKSRKLFTHLCHNFSILVTYNKSSYGLIEILNCCGPEMTRLIFLNTGLVFWRWWFQNYTYIAKSYLKESFHFCKLTILIEHARKNESYRNNAMHVLV